ncbi:MAG TPA: ABC transporter ATP-binding protein [Terriglobales bacterium]|nr:ABC transporter ATP-binding protein [Terriglobales bacterium]
MPAIEIIGLKKKYSVGFWRKSERWGLRGLTLSVDEGEVFGCLGPNGAGKTTTLKLLMGLIYPSAGEARILGMPVNDPGVKAEIGFLPEQPYFYDYLTPTELLGYYARLSGVPAGEIPQKLTAALMRVGMAETADTQLRKFSKGMLQRVGIAQAILHDPKVVFLDEPMSGLDPVGRHEVRELIEQLRNEGRTIFFSTHILSDAETLCNRIAVMHKGELRGVSAVSELVAATAGKTEIVVQGAGVDALQTLGSDSRLVGDSLRFVVASQQLDGALETIRKANVRLISVNPLRGNLEEYFLGQVSGDPIAGGNA